MTASELFKAGQLQAAIDAQSDLGITFLTVKVGYVEGMEAALACADGDKARELLGVIERLRPGDRPPMLAAHAHRVGADLDVAGSAGAAGRSEDGRLVGQHQVAGSDVQVATALAERPG